MNQPITAKDLLEAVKKLRDSEPAPKTMLGTKERPLICWLDDGSIETLGDMVQEREGDLIKVSGLWIRIEGRVEF